MLIISQETSVQKKYDRRKPVISFKLLYPRRQPEILNAVSSFYLRPERPESGDPDPLPPREEGALWPLLRGIDADLVLIRADEPPEEDLPTDGEDCTAEGREALLPEETEDGF